MHYEVDNSSLKLLSITQDWLHEISRLQLQISSAVQVMENNFKCLTVISQQPEFQVCSEMQLLLDDFCDSLDAWHDETIQHIQTISHNINRGSSSLNQLVNLLGGGNKANTEMLAESADSGLGLNETIRKLKDKESAVAALREDVEALEEACRKLEAQRHFKAESIEPSSLSFQPDDDNASFTQPDNISEIETDSSVSPEQGDLIGENTHELEAQISELYKLLEEERNNSERLESRQTVLVAELNTLRAADLARRDALAKEREKNNALTEELDSIRNAVVDYPAIEINNNERSNSTNPSPETTFVENQELLLDEDDWAIVEEDAYSHSPSESDNNEKVTQEADSDEMIIPTDTTTMLDDSADVTEQPEETIEPLPDAEPDPATNTNPTNEDIKEY